MNIDANKIIERYAEENKNLQFKIYVLEAQLEALQESDNEETIKEPVDDS